MTPATCHPNRRRDRRGLCVECALDQRAKRLGLKRLPSLPKPVPGTFQHCYYEPPESCPHCHRVIPLVRDGREIHCVGGRGGCGYMAYLVSSPLSAP